MSLYSQIILRQRMAAKTAAKRAGQHWGRTFAGSAAYRNGQSPVQCPHELDTPYWREWYYGWQMLFDRGHGHD